MLLYPINNVDGGVKYIHPRSKQTTSKESKAMTEDQANQHPNMHFIRQIISNDIDNGKNAGNVITRFPPEPNGYLHIGHAKSICLNFGIANEFHGKCNLRMDDTNPCKENIEYQDAIMEDIQWLGFNWGNRLFYASDYYQQLYDYAESLIIQGKAYVCSLSADEVKSYRGTITEPGKKSPYYNRTIEDNLDLFRRMKGGEFPDGQHILRAKIDMTSPNLNMRDPTIYRIRHTSHHRTSNTWCIYPMYDFAHCISDALEGITHSICTLEFEDHRPLYDWFLNQLNVPCHPQQIEFARLNLNYTIMSKRKLLELVEKKDVRGWDDPRMPTLSGMRRRGYPAVAIRAFCEQIGVSKVNSIVDINLLNFFVREELNKSALRVMAVLHPLKVIIDNYPDDLVEELDAENNPEDLSAGTRKIPFSKTIYIEQDDFREDPPKKFFRLSPGREIRLKHAYYITCVNVIKDENTGVINELHCTYDPKSRGGWSHDGRKVLGTSHWVSAAHALDAEVRLYEHLFTTENPGETEDYATILNPNSFITLSNCKVEPGLAKSESTTPYQFLRQGYFCVDSHDSQPDKLVFNRTIILKDTWAKIATKG